MSFNTRATRAPVTINGKTVSIVDLIAQMQAEAARGAAHIPPGGPGGFGGADSQVKPSRPSSYYVLPFGKHRGTPINEVPEDYLRWLISKDERAAAMLVRYPELRAEVEKHSAHRSRHWSARIGSGSWRRGLRIWSIYSI